MKFIFYRVLFICIFLLIYSCSSEKTSENKTVKLEGYKSTGAEIATLAQSVLIQNLSDAIEKGGPEYAVQFCNVKASEIIDSVSKLNNCVVSRVTDRNRNPGNILTSPLDKSIWAQYINMKDQGILVDTLLESEHEVFYYKPIKIGMPACLKCHGKAGTDINESTLAIIDSLYPYDLAKNYSAGDLRGLWKIEFKKDHFNSGVL